MNKQRRKELETISDEIEKLIERLESARDDEQEYFDNMPESIQAGERGERAEYADQMASLQKSPYLAGHSFSVSGNYQS